MVVFLEGADELTLIMRKYWTTPSFNYPIDDSLLFPDIQEFYELTLLDDTKSVQQKTVETLQIASKWEQEAKFSVESAVVNKVCFNYSPADNHAIASSKDNTTKYFFPPPHLTNCKLLSILELCKQHGR